MRVLVLCGRTLNDHECGILEPFWTSDRNEICACLIDGRPEKPLLQRLKQNFRKGRGGYILVMAINLLSRKRMQAESTEAVMREHRVPILTTAEPYSEETLDWIRSFQPDILALISGYGIVKKPLLEITPHGMLSYHHGNMRKYRGMPPGLWELYNGEPEMGVTLQRLDPGLDSGSPIIEKTIKISPNDTVRALQERAFEQSRSMLFEAVELLNSGGFTPKPVETLGQLYTLPNLRQWLVLNSRITWRRIKFLFGYRGI